MRREIVTDKKPYDTAFKRLAEQDPEALLRLVGALPPGATVGMQVHGFVRAPREGVLQIDTGSASFNAPQADAELPTALWFDVARFPRASFQSESIRNLGYGRLEVAGRLTIKGQARQVVVPVAITQTEGKSVATGTFAIRRLEFRVGDGDWSDTAMVADEVQVRFKLTLTGLGPL